MSLPYPALILDFGGVITTNFHAALRTFCVREGLAPDALEQLFRDDPVVRAFLIDAERGRVSQGELEIVLGNALGIDSVGLLGRVAADLRPCQPVLDLAEHARTAGTIVGVLSNSWGTDTHDVYDTYNLDDRFDSVVISDKVGMRKPDEDIYLLMVDKLGVAPADCVFVDDTPANLSPAQALGMAVVHFTDVATGVAEIRSLIGLARP